MAELLDFQIDTMKFRLAVDNTAYSSTNTGRPYRRSTAQFRKDQIDSSGTPGDNSLTGWWTHGQLSFHKGSGFNFYDISSAQNADDILYGFKESLGVQVFTPGKAMLAGYPKQDPLAQNGDYWDDFCSVGDGILAGIRENLDGTATLYTFAGNVPTATVVTTDATYGNPWSLVPATNGNWFVVQHGTANGECLLRKSTTSGGWQPDGVIYTNLPSDNVFFGKGRLWVIADSGEVYTLDPNPSGTTPIAFSAANNTPAVTLPALPNTPPIFPAFAETPGAVYVAMGSNQIYRIDLASDGSVPTLAAPVVVASLPNGEAVSALREHLGYLCIATTNTVRVAIINADGSLTYGPSLIETEKGTRPYRIGAHGDRFLVVGMDPHTGVTGAWAVNLADSLSTPLQFPIEQLGQINQSSWRTFGITEWQNDGWAAWTGRSFIVAQPSPYDYVNPSGWLRTSTHRFGTLDPKAFISVVITTENQDTTGGGWSSGGAIDVYYSTETVTDLHLGSTQGPGAFEFEIPSEYRNAVGATLKFSFTRALGDDRWQGLSLLGYQLKALPLPKRQRLIEVPLLMRDVFKTRTGVTKGRTGNGWSQLQALEALESSKAIVPYTDFRTGETGTAYIDGVEFYGDNLTSPADRTFGGIAYVALRVIS